nr:Gal-binding and CUB domains containing receptor 18 [Arenicola marina]
MNPHGAMKPLWISTLGACPSRHAAIVTVYFGLISVWITRTASSATTKPIEEFACFNTVFEITCQENEVIIFDTARYGRNDTAVGARCQVPYQRNCDVDVHFPLNRVCAGKPKCSLAVNTALFGDPCGYEEFLRVTYRCVTVSAVHQTCYGVNGPHFYDHGFLASPNYPSKYYVDADCYWRLSVQRRQRIKVTLLDFELDVKRGGLCYDYVEISAEDKVYFKDCGAMGKQVVIVDSHQALIRFKTTHGSLTQRGFLVFFEALGPGCPDLEALPNGMIDYYIEEDILFANATCGEDYLFSGTEVASQIIQCSGSYWNTILTPCVAPASTTIPPIIVTTNKKTGNNSVIDKSGSLIEPESHGFVFVFSIALGVVSAILLITLLLVLALYFHKRRRHAERKLDQWRFVINNLQENALNEESAKPLESAMDGSESPSCNVRRAKRARRSKKQNNREDEWQGRNLLQSAAQEDEDPTQRSGDTILKYTDEDMSRYAAARRGSGGPRPGKYALARSRDSQLDGPARSPVAMTTNAVWENDYDRPSRLSRRDLKHKRAKSGQWDPPQNADKQRFYNAKASAAAILDYYGDGHYGCGNMTIGPEIGWGGGGYDAREEPCMVRKHFTQSAPDLLDMSMFSAKPDVSFFCPSEMCSPIDPPAFLVNNFAPAAVAHPRNAPTTPRGNTLGMVPPPPPPRTTPVKVTTPTIPRTSSRGKIRC